MFLIESNIEDAMQEYPIISEWIDVAKKHIIKADVDNSKIKIYYSYGFFNKKIKTDEDLKSYEDMFEESLKMEFNERLKYELSKVRVDANIVINKFAMKNRLPKGSLPKEVVEMTTEIVKIKMMLEEGDDDVYNSIPPLSGMFDFEDIYGEQDYQDSELDMDEILDKISKSGMKSLTDEEKEFLNNKSKDF